MEEADTRPLKDRVREYVCQTDHVTFAELASRFGDAFHGGEMQVSKGENIVLWAGMTEEAADAVSELLDEGAIVPWPTGVLTYLIDGRALSYPVMKQARRYKTPHWLPVTLRPAAAARR